MKNPNDFQRDKIRSVLKYLTIKIEYADVYNKLTHNPIYERLNLYDRDPQLMKAKIKEMV